jgi:hypothetical protein
MKGLHLADFDAVAGKLLCYKFILQVSRYSYRKFLLQKNLFSWALETSSIINCQSREKKGSKTANFAAVEGKLLRSNFTLKFLRHTFGPAWVHPFGS